MFTKLDIYIIKKFFGAFILAMSLIILIVIIFDISEKIDDFIEKDAPLKGIIFSYYLNFIPYFVNLFSSLFVFISVIFFTAKMANDTEFIAILGSGISFRRILRPYVFTSVIIAGFSFYLANFVIPPANEARLEFEKTFLKSAYHHNESNIHRLIDGNKLLHLKSFNAFHNRAVSLSIETLENGMVSEHLYAEFARFDSTTGNWSLEQYTKRFFNDMEESMLKGYILDTNLGFLPEELSEKMHHKEAMDFFRLNNYIAKESEKGTEGLEVYKVERHNRIASPFSTIILTLIGASIAARKIRGGIGLHIGAGIALSFTYIMFMQISTTFAIYGNLDPFTAVWIPNFIYGIFAIILIRYSPK